MIMSSTIYLLLIILTAVFKEKNLSSKSLPSDIKYFN